MTGPTTGAGAVTHAPCGCPQHLGRQIVDQAKHDAWHQLVVEQGGPAGDVSTASLRRARGFLTGTPAVPIVVDDKAVASGKRRASPAAYREAVAREQARRTRPAPAASSSTDPPARPAPPTTGDPRP